MAKESGAKEKRERKDKKEKKRSDTEGVHKSKKDKTEKQDKKEKKEKKDKKAASDDVDADGDLTAVVLNALEAETPGSVAVVANGAVVAKEPVPVGALVPFANPLAGDKVQKKVLKSVRKAAKNKALKRGVKEVVKSLRKSATPAATGGPAPGIVVLAADISPMDVISHIPVLCEDHSVPYIFVTSRAELGAAGSTKRPTSVVMVSPERTGKRKAGEAGDEAEEAEFKDVYKELLKTVEKESRNTKLYPVTMASGAQSKAEIIEERKANLPLPEQPPVPSDFNSMDARTVNVGSGGVQSDISTSSSGLREPAAADSSVRVDGNEGKTSTAPDGAVGRQGKDGLDSLPRDAVTRDAKNKV
ncbi:MAG: snoRNA-binding protein [Thelocarpon impressellum]|nr:MAG: snoRNA-binding protein [Thelocarpon impressellum]